MIRWAAVFVLLCVSCKKPQAPEVSASESKPVLVAAALAVATEPPPSWTAAPPAVIMRGRKRYAVAVGQALTGEKALARAAAEERARAEILRLLHGKHSGVSVQGAVIGAQVKRSYTAPDGRVFVELEAPVHR